MAFDHDHFAIETLDQELESLPLFEALKTAEHYLTFFEDEHTSAYIEHLRVCGADLRLKVAADKRDALAGIAGGNFEIEEKRRM